MFDDDAAARALFLEIQSTPDKDQVFTAERFKSCYPAKHKAAVEMYSQGMSESLIADVLHVSRNTLAILFKKLIAETPVEQVKKENAIRWRYLARLSMDRVEEILRSPNINEAVLKALTILGAVGEDKAELLSGGATARIEYKEPPRPSQGTELDRFIASLPVVSPLPIQSDEAIPQPNAGEAGREASAGLQDGSAMAGSGQDGGVN